MIRFPTPVLATAALSCAAASILSAAWALDRPWMNFVFKPLATLAIIAFAWPRGGDRPEARRWVLVGLAASLAGDIALLWPQQGFLPGLLSFLAAHLAYLRAFTRDGVRLGQPAGPFVAYGLLAAIILWQLWPGVPPALHLPVLAYVVCLASMAAQAAAWGWQALGTPRQRSGIVLALGGALFLCSDALLAANRFAAPLTWASLWILSSYWLAQWCIASWLTPAARHPPAGSAPPRSR